ncbi:MAG TPA: hypothetical protein VFD58_32055 [Blastocatellia bacterium]|nr:hypothetical protein [Blastocatellia bacterium]
MSKQTQYKQSCVVTPYPDQWPIKQFKVRTNDLRCSGLLRGDIISIAIFAKPRRGDVIVWRTGGGRGYRASVYDPAIKVRTQGSVCVVLRTVAPVIASQVRELDRIRAEAAKAELKRMRSKGKSKAA